MSLIANPIANTISTIRPYGTFRSGRDFKACLSSQVRRVEHPLSIWNTIGRTSSGYDHRAHSGPGSPALNPEVFSDFLDGQYYVTNHNNFLTSLLATNLRRRWYARLSVKEWRKANLGLTEAGTWAGTVNPADVLPFFSVLCFFVWTGFWGDISFSSSSVSPLLSMSFGARFLPLFAAVCFHLGWRGVGCSTWSSSVSPSPSSSFGAPFLLFFFTAGFRLVRRGSTSSSSLTVATVGPLRCL